VTWPHLVGVLPRQADHFQDRGANHLLERATAGAGTAVLCQVLAGMGGVGKTQLAAHHARTLWRDGQLDLLVWITASSRTAIVSGYAEAAAAVLDADPADPDRAARAFLAWLEPGPATNLRWMVVLDDLTDPADLRGLWPPAGPHGRTLITTRRRDALLQGDGRRLVPVGLFTEREATAYLTATLATHHRHEPAGRLTSLAADLGHLPLALSQAAAYLVDTDLDCAAYRRLLTDRARTLAEALRTPGGPLPDDQATTAAAAWSLSIDRADQLPPLGLARPMLQLAAMLNPNGIPAPVLTSAPALIHLAERATRPTDPTDEVQEEPRRWWLPRVRRRSRPPVTPAHATAEDVLGVLRTLHRLSLIDYTPAIEHQAVRIHQLIQRSVRDTLPPARLAHCARTAADALVTAWPDTERDTALDQALRANTDALRSCAEDALYQSGAHEVLFRTSKSLAGSGQAEAALTYARDLAEEASRRLGPDHPDTLRVRSDVAEWRAETGDAAGAAAAYAELLGEMRQVLGEDHRHTLMARGSLAHWQGVAGDRTGAAAAYAELLRDVERVLGPVTPEAIAVRSELAHWQGEAGDAAGAAATFAVFLSAITRAVGPEHPVARLARRDAARWQGEAGDAAGAVAAFAELLSDTVRAVGPDAPETLTTRGELAHWQGRSGDAAGAVAAFAELLTDMLRVFGPEHRHTLAAQNNLAFWRGRAGDAAAAAPTDS
jgi:hypothetical protein